MVVPAFSGSRLDTAKSLAGLRRKTTAANTITACQSLIAEHVNINFSHISADDPLSAAAIMEKRYGKKSKLLATHVHDRRTREFWPAADTPFHFLTEDDLERIERRRDVHKPCGSDWLLALPVNNKMTSTKVQTTTARRLRMPICAAKSRFPGCGDIANAFGDHEVATCPCGGRFGVISRNERHKNVADTLQHDFITPAQLRASLKIPRLLPETNGRYNLDSPADILVSSSLGCGRTDADKTSLAIDDTVAKADADAPHVWCEKTAATRAKEEYVGKFESRVSDMNAALSTEGKEEWTSPLVFRGFSDNAHVALGKDPQAIIQLLAGRRAARSPMSLGLCK